jgi:hypothetical protein
MKQTAVEWLGLQLNMVFTDITEEQWNRAEKLFQQAKEMEEEQRGYSEEEVLNFTQTMIMQYKFGNTNIEQMDLLKESLEQFKKK